MAADYRQPAVEPGADSIVERSRRALQRISLPEMERWVKGRGAIGDYLHHLYTHNTLHELRAVTDREQRTLVLWDMINLAWLINPAWVPSHLTTWRRPLLGGACGGAHDARGPCC